MYKLSNFNFENERFRNGARYEINIITLQFHSQIVNTMSKATFRS